MAGMKGLVKDTAIYGLSSIVGRFLNWCLVPLYTNVFTQGEYGVVTNIYAYVAVTLVILIYGLETGFFRFANHEKYNDPDLVYTTGLTSLAVSSSAFFIAILLFLHPIAGALGCGSHPEFIWIMALTVAIDAFTSLPFAYLRYQKRAWRFALIKLLSIAINIGMNLFFILLCPVIYRHHPAWIEWFYDPTWGVGYIFAANLISSAIVLLALTPEIFRRYRFNAEIWKRMLVYSYPILILGVAGIMNQSIDKILFPFLIPGEEGVAQLGIYGANYKIAIIMVMFTQAFRFAYEPFIFEKHKKSGGDSLSVYSEAMKYFIIFGLFIFLGVMFYLDILKYFIGQAFFSGLAVVPIVMLAELFFGIFFNLSLWYKLTDRTIWGAYFSLFGCAITVSINILFVPRFGYMASAWAAFTSYLAMMLASYFIGQRKFPIRYDLRSALRYSLLTAVLYLAAVYIEIANPLLRYSFRTLLLAVYIAYTIRHDLPLKELPFVGKHFTRKK